MAIKKSQPKPPVKKYTAQDSINYRRMNDRQDADYYSQFKNFPKEGPKKATVDRMNRRMDSMENSPYFKAKSKVEVKNGVSYRTLTETNKKAKSTKPAPAKMMTKAKSKAVATKKPMMKSTKK
jgi:hypothetical protein